MNLILKFVNFLHLKNSKFQYFISKFTLPIIKFLKFNFIIKFFALNFK